MHDPYVAFWVVCTVVMAVIEASTLNMITIWFAAGSLGALIVTLCGGSFGLQLFVFFAVSAILLATLMPIAKKAMQAKKQPTNADRIIGAEAKVTEAIDSITGKGQIKVMGSIWSARCETESIPENTIVTVERIEGVKAVVKRKVGN